MSEAVATVDLFIAGGGLAGLSLAAQITTRHPGLRVVLCEKRRSAPTTPAYKVGEALTEGGTWYLRQVAGLGDEILAHVPKLGIRFFMQGRAPEDFSDRLELGLSHYLRLTAYNIDRGLVERQLAARCVAQGVDLRWGTRMEAVDLDGSDAHLVTVRGPEGTQTLRARWFVDATGRAQRLQKQLDLAVPSRHGIAAAWFRWDGRIDAEEWVGPHRPWPPEWPERFHSAVHLVGPGRWLWIIPLPEERTSVGLVVDHKFFRAEEIDSFDKLTAWLDRHEPSLSGLLRANPERRMDFACFRDASYSVSQAFSVQRWALLGDAGAFGDPLFSLGNDFVGLSCTLTADLISRDLDGQDLSATVEAHNRTYTQFFGIYLRVVRGQYHILGSPRVMALKAIWDFGYYWALFALLQCTENLANPEIWAGGGEAMRQLGSLGLTAQRLFHRWAKAAPGGPVRGFLNYGEVPWLRGLNAQLVEPLPAEALPARLARNAALLDEVLRELGRAAEGDVPGLNPLEPATTDHMDGVLAVLGAGRTDC